MGKGANAAVLAKLALSANQPIYLYQVDMTGGVYYRFAKDQTMDITFNGFTWRAASIGHAPVGNSKDASIDEASVKIAVIAHELAAHLASGNTFNGLEVTIYKVFNDALGDPANYVLEFFGQIDGWTYEEAEDASWLTVRVRRNQGTFGKIIPRRRYKVMCPWIFKGTECGYAGAETLCDRTITRCLALGNEDNFGGFPWVPHPMESTSNANVR